MPTKAAAYCRYSTDMQREESAEAQLRAIREYAEKKDIIITREYIDRAATGKTMDREAFKQMLTDARNEQFQLVLVHKTNRFARNREEAAFCRYKLKKSGVKVVAVAEDFGEGPHAVLMEAIMEGLAEYYSLELATETMKGLITNAYKCQFNGGHLLYGYQLNPDKTFAINEDESRAVKIIYNKFLAGWSYKEIMQYLNKNHHHTRQGKPWSKSALYEMLRNEKYSGTYVYNKNTSRSPDGKRTSRINKNEGEVIRVPDGMPAIIPRPKWEKTQETLDERKHKHVTSPRLQYLLTGFIKCDHCGGSFCGSITKTKYTTKRYYACTTKKNIGSGACSNINLPVDKTDSEILQYITELVSAISIDDIYEAIVKLQKSFYGEELQEIKRIDRAIRGLDKKIDNLLSLVEDGEAGAVVKPRLKEHPNQKKELERLRANIEVSDHEISKDKIKQIINKLNPEGKSQEAVRETLHSLRFRMIVSRDKKTLTIGEPHDNENSLRKYGVGDASQQLCKLIMDLSLTY